MKTYPVVIGIVIFNENILLLKRVPNSMIAPNKWQVVSGFIPEFEAVEDTILREVKEETGLDGEIIKQGPLNITEADNRKWINIPFLIKVTSDKVIISDEHSEFVWIKPIDYEKYDCINGVKLDLEVFGLI